MQTPSLEPIVERLLAPISERLLAGESIRHTPLFEEIKEARREEMDLPQGQWVRPRKVADWDAVEALSTEVLYTKSKDLQIAAWLSEARVKRDGFSGLPFALHLLRHLLQTFWETLYPQPEENDVEHRSAILESLSEDLGLAIRQVPITLAPSYTWVHWQQAQRAAQLARSNGVAADQGDATVTEEQFGKAVEATSRAHFETLLRHLEESRSIYEELLGVVNAQFAGQAPSLQDVCAAIDDCRHLITDIVKKKQELEPEPPPVSVEPTAIPETVEDYQQSFGAGAAHTTTTRSAPPSRTLAVQHLKGVAEYFHAAEPQNPVNCLLDRALRWLQMSFAELLPEIIRDESALLDACDRLGLKKTAGEE